MILIDNFFMSKKYFEDLRQNMYLLFFEIIYTIQQLRIKLLEKQSN